VAQFLSISATILAYAIAAVVGLAFFQVLDFINSLLDLRTARDSKIGRRAARRRFTEYFWSIPATVTLGLVLALGVDLAGRQFFDYADIPAGLTTMVVALLIALFGGLGIVYAIIRSETLSYAVLRANLEEDLERRDVGKRLAGYREQLEQVDEKHRKIRFGLRDRSTLRRMRERLNQISERFRDVPPVGIEALRSIPWRYAWVYLWRGNLLRVVPPIIAAAGVLLLLSTLVATADWAYWWVLLIGFSVLAISSLLALGSARASLASKTAWHAVYLKQRTEVEDLLIELEKATRKGVAGLGDRVARALQILREQQE
jgi:hypothetical protein